MRNKLIAIAGAFTLLAFAGCGGGDEPTPEERATEQSTVPETVFEPSADDFPKARGRSLEQIANEVLVGPQVGLATSVFTPGENRLAFGVIDQEQKFVYGPTAVYLAEKPNQPARGPFLAPADSLVTEDQFKSAQSATEGSSIAAIYSADVELPKPGRWSVLVVTRLGDELRGAATEIEVGNESPVPGTGDTPPEINTETVEEAGPNTDLLDTRDPADNMHETDFAEVVGEQPVALLFATPAYCESRVCGPVTDIAAELQAEYGEEVEFIHQEVYVDNDASKGLRPPLEEFGLPSEPWLFTFDTDGKVAARLEGSFGLREFEEAVQAARG